MDRPRRPQDLPEYRAAAVANDDLWQILPQADALMGKQDFQHVDLIREELEDARLWWVGAEAAELICEAAIDMPATTLTPELLPDERGFVYFDSPLIGLDSDTAEVRVEVDFIQWAIANVVGQRAISMISWVHGREGIPFPLGRADWLMDTDSLDGLEGVNELAMASIIEDRRRLAALWQLSSQGSITESADDVPVDRATRRRWERRERPWPKVRLVNLAARHRAAPEPAEGGSGRVYTRRWVVGGHWRQQACGPRWSQHRPVYIAPHIKGPEDAPLVVAEPVKVWRG